MNANDSCLSAFIRGSIFQVCVTCNSICENLENLWIPSSYATNRACRRADGRNIHRLRRLTQIKVLISGNQCSCSLFPAGGRGGSFAPSAVQEKPFPAWRRSTLAGEFAF